MNAHSACLNVVGLGRLSPAKHVVEPGENILGQVDTLARLAHASHGDRAHSIEHVGVTVVETHLAHREII